MYHDDVHSVKWAWETAHLILFYNPYWIPNRKYKVKKISYWIPNVYLNSKVHIYTPSSCGGDPWAPWMIIQCPKAFGAPLQVIIPLLKLAFALYALTLMFLFAEFPSCRLVLSIMGFLGFVNVYALRVNLSVAMVAMVNSSYQLQKNGSEDSCPGPDDPTNSTRQPVSEKSKLTFKPIFHQNAKYLAVGVGQCTRRQNFALPKAKYTNMLVSLALGDAHFSRFTHRET